MKTRPGRALTTFAVAVVLAVAGVASATTATGSGLSAGVALGSGTFGPGCTAGGPLSPFCDTRSLSFRLLAVSAPAGHATGWFERTNLANGNTFAGPVTCLEVQDGRASVGGVITRTPSPTGEGVGIPYLVYVADNGSPDGISPFEVFGPGDPGLGSLPAGFPQDCPPPAAPLGYFSLNSGGIAVLGG